MRSFEPFIWINFFDKWTNNWLSGNLSSRWSETESTGRPSVPDAAYSAKWKVSAGNQWTLGRFSVSILERAAAVSVSRVYS
jgi:hypothetical protein